MKRLISWLVMMVLLFTAGIASAHGLHAGHTEKKLSVLVNGVDIQSDLNHIHQSKVYVDMEEFADLFGKTFELSKNKKVVTFNGKKLNDIRFVNGEPTVWIDKLGTAVGAQNISWDEKNGEAYMLVLPEGTIQLDPHVVPAMGEHWANPKEMPNGPIYGVHNGTLVFIEYMIAQDDFVNGKSHTNLGGMKGLPSPSVVQTDIEFQPHGHLGFDIAHFDIHAYFISDEEQHKIGTTFVELKNGKGEKIGFAAFGQMGDQIMLKVSASGLTPGKHGFHIHQNAITNNDFTTAGGHFNPSDKKHGHDNPEGAHLGDLPNLTADENGEIEQTIFLSGVSLEKGKSNSILGKSLIIHAAEDDGETDPSGNSGDRVAGGNIPE
ncbi:superoxide dismutase family protein [Priestia abyssalis]|uniref:superoxide dismutase family protein n=1 Tax=Priestia abyssalis TaxID=1221450 RepID=UPI000994D912|nr:superoxide dismutase family protein [Priestia abyssalis]